jgi:hypothetical protein
MVTPVFVTSIFEVVMACFNLSGVVVEIALRATMSVAPDNPENASGFESHVRLQVVCQVGVPFTSSNFSDRKTRWSDFGIAESGHGI